LEDKIKINVSVAGRNYPIKANAVEEEYIRKGVDFIEKRMNIIQEKYDIKDIQDTQALILIELATELSYLQNKQETESRLIENKIDQMLQL